MQFSRKKNCPSYYMTEGIVMARASNLSQRSELSYRARISDEFMYK